MRSMYLILLYENRVFCIEHETRTKNTNKINRWFGGDRSCPSLWNFATSTRIKWRNWILGRLNNILGTHFEHLLKTKITIFFELTLGNKLVTERKEKKIETKIKLMKCVIITRTFIIPFFHLIASYLQNVQMKEKKINKYEKKIFFFCYFTKIKSNKWRERSHGAFDNCRVSVHYVSKIIVILWLFYLYVQEKKNKKNQKGESK